MKAKRKYNWQPDLPDHRDFLFTAPLTIQKKVPTSVDLRKACSPVENQGAIGSCTANALAGNLEFLELSELKNKDNAASEVFQPGRFENISRLFIYYNERALEGTTATDHGASLRDGIKALTQWGACRESLWDYSSKNVFKKPVSKAYQEAAKHKIDSYYRIESLSEMKQCLAQGYPFVFGFAVYESFESAEVAQSGIMPYPEKDEKLLGGHAVMAVGYNDAKKRILVRNSWGAEWGLQGYFYMPYAVIENSNLSSDFWTLRK